MCISSHSLNEFQKEVHEVYILYIQHLNENMVKSLISHMVIDMTLQAKQPSKTDKLNFTKIKSFIHKKMFIK